MGNIPLQHNRMPMCEVLEQWGPLGREVGRPSNTMIDWPRNKKKEIRLLIEECLRQYQDDTRFMRHAVSPLFSSRITRDLEPFTLPYNTL